MMSNTNSEKLIATTKNLPDQPGVYFFKKGSEVVYVGKATSLRDRVRSYFVDDLALVRSPLVAKVIRSATKIDYQVTDSVLEALVLEANLIKKYKPVGNTAQKDDKSYNYVVFTNEAFPRIFTVRAHDLTTKYDPEEFKYVFGPYTSGSSLKKALRLIRRIFPFRGEKDPVELSRRHSPLNEQLGLVPHFRDTDKKEYGRLVNNLRLFFEGKKGKLVKDLNKQMMRAAKELRFEEANKLKNTIYALEHINDTSLLTDEFLAAGEKNVGLTIESYDVAHSQGESMVGVMIVMEDGLFNKARYRKFKIRRYKRANDTGALKEVLERRLNHSEWPLPRLLVVDGGQAQYNTAIKVLEENGLAIPVVAVTKGEGHKPKGYIGDQELIREHELDILQANNEAHRFAITYHRDKQRKKRFDI